MSKKYDVSGHLHDAWTVDDMVIDLNGVSILPSSLLTYEILWAGDSIRGIVSFIDYQNLQANGAIDSGGILTISYTSQKGSRYGKEAPLTLRMSISEVKIGKEKNQVITLILKDVMDAALSVRFLNKSYMDQTPEDMIKNYTKDLGLGELGFTGPMKVKEQKVDVSTPAHLSAYDVLKSTTKKNGYSIMHDKTYSGVVHDEALEEDNLPHTGETFYYLPKEEYTRFQIISYDLNGFTLEALEKSCARETNKLTLDNVGAGEEINSTSTTNISSSTKTIAGMPAKTGQKGLKTDATLGATTATKSINELQTMTAWVLGWNGNRLNQKVTIELPTPENSSQIQSAETFSGEWVVMRVLDKIVSSFFIQQLLLRRAGS